ncbi:MAG: SusC/RagA family TonB-linked outer membrane protein [Gemmatimonadetes bacterium]|nr:SusC/RagA family TonB-linked outer membrane protein [Gemmatimonadota bacterium]
MRPIIHQLFLRRASRVAWMLLGVLQLTWAPSVLPAQGTAVGAIAGVIKDARTQQPIAGATIGVEGTLIAGATGTDGRYRLANVPTGARFVTVRRIGYTGTRSSVTVAASRDVTLDVELQPAAISLDQVVVTGTAGGETRRSIGNSVVTIDVSDALGKSVAPSLSNLLAARAPGVVVATGTSRLGASQAIQIRGRSSLSLDNSPLLYVDGIRVNSATGLGVGAGGFSAQGGSVGGRLNDINPEDIESIEIIKGPSAATIYGTEAANGVIQVITKKGAAAGKAHWNFQIKAGSLDFTDAGNRIRTNYFKDATGTIIPWNGVKQEAARGTPLFNTGTTRDYTAAVSGGRDGISYYVSGDFENDQGIEANNALRRFTTHANLNVVATPELVLATSLNFVNLNAHLGTDFGASAMLGAEAGHSSLFPAGRGFYPNWQPGVAQKLWDNSQAVNRFTGSETITHHPFSWLTQRLVVGLDQTNEDDRDLERFATPDLSAGLSPSAAAGRIAQTLRNYSYITGDYSSTATANITPTISSTSSLGLQFYRTELNISTAGGLSFPAPGVEMISATATPITPTQSYTLNTTIGGYFQQRFGWRDRVFVTAAVRVDNNSAFGSGFKWVTYPKISGTWVVSEESFWKANKWVDALRLRTAYGESGRQPAAFAALRTFTPVQGPGGTNAVTPGSIGNSGLKPERGKEFEVGIEGSLMGRLSFDLTYWTKKTFDEIVARGIAPSSGFAGTQFSNLGQVDNSGAELLLTYQAMSRKNVDWQITYSISTNGDIIKSLGGVPSLVTSEGQFNVIGYPIGGLWSRRVVSADHDATTGFATNVLCDGGPGKASVACATAPFVYLGSPTPARSGSLGNTLTLYKRLRLYALVDFRSGNRLVNAVDKIRCQGLAGAGLCDVNYNPKNYPATYVAAANISAYSAQMGDAFIEDGSFVKFRELSATYSFPDWLPGLSRASMTLAARELHLWSKYSGIDPEVNSANAATSITTQDQGLVPPLQRILLTLNYKF